MKPTWTDLCFLTRTFSTKLPQEKLDRVWNEENSPSERRPHNFWRYLGGGAKQAAQNGLNRLFLPLSVPYLRRSLNAASVGAMVSTLTGRLNSASRAPSVGAGMPRVCETASGNLAGWAQARVTKGVGSPVARR